MRLRHLLSVPALLVGVPVLAAAPVEVTRFHTPETMARIANGAMEIVAEPGIDTSSLETRAWLDAVARELFAQGFATATPGAATRVAEVRLTRDAAPPSEARRGGGSGVNVGVGVGSGWGGGYGRRGGGGFGSVGVGIGFPIGKRDYDRGRGVDTELAVRIRDKASGAPLWEGRATLRTTEREADRPETAARLARSLFTGFPGKSGETIEVK